jgi:phage protein D
MSGEMRPNTTRAPRLRVLFGGKEIPGAMSASVRVNNWYQADDFDLTFALYADRGFDAAWWSDQTDMLVDIQIGYEAGGSVAWKSMLIGAIENVEIYLSTGRVSVNGKDLAVRLIQAKTQETFQNQTASEIVATLAGRHGMTANATATTTLAGTYWKQDHSTSALGQFSRQTSEWDLLTTLARYEGFDLYVEGTVLHFHPPVASDGPQWAVDWSPPQTADRVSYGQASNVNNLRLQRSLTLARDIEVAVRSWHSGKGAGFTKTVRAIGAKSASAGKAANQSGFAANTQRYVYVIPNLTEDQALKKAQALLADLSKFERVISWAEPGQLVLTPRNMAILRGTGTNFDQSYYIDSIERRIAFEEGFTMHIRAKNRDSRSQAQVG